MSFYWISFTVVEWLTIHSTITCFDFLFKCQWLSGWSYNSAIGYNTAVVEWLISKTVTVEKGHLIWYSVVCVVRILESKTIKKLRTKLFFYPCGWVVEFAPNIMYDNFYLQPMWLSGWSHNSAIGYITVVEWLISNSYSGERKPDMIWCC